VWDTVYATKAAGDVSWFQEDPATSRRLLTAWASPDGSVVDIGAGESTLVDWLLNAGWADITLVDLSAQALDNVRARLGRLAEQVSFAISDVVLWRPERTFDTWHDRAVFHFLVDRVDRDHYVALAARSVVPGGVVVLASFAADGPTSCSGLPTARYDAEDLARVFAPAFTLETDEPEEHVTPWGAVQPFTWVVLRRSASASATD
jgi:SAM-dependent methyltransferase